MCLSSRSSEALAKTNVARASAPSTRRKRSGLDDTTDWDRKVTPGELRRRVALSSRARSLWAKPGGGDTWVFRGCTDTFEVRVCDPEEAVAAMAPAETGEIEALDCTAVAGAWLPETTGELATPPTAFWGLPAGAFDAELLGAERVSLARGAGSGDGPLADCAEPLEGAGSGERPAARAADDAITPTRSIVTTAISRRTPKAQTVG